MIVGYLAPMDWLRANAALLIGEGLKVVGMIVAALTVVWQLRRQHNNAVELQRENAREALKLRVYESLLQRIRSTADAYVDASVYAFGIVPAFESRREVSAEYNRSPLKQRALTFSDLHFKAQGQFTELLIEFESWSIAIPGLNVFQVALNAANFDVSQSFGPLYSALLVLLPMELPNEIHTPPLPSDAAFAELKRRVEDYKKAMDAVQNYISDLAVEAQNNLLHGLFPTRVPARKPLDPRCKVISTDPANVQALIQYFETETAWGRHQAEITADVLSEVQRQAAGAPGTQ